MMRCVLLALAMALWANPSLSARVGSDKLQTVTDEPTEVEEDEGGAQTPKDFKTMWKTAAMKYAKKCDCPEATEGDEMSLVQETKTDSVVESSFLEDQEVYDMISNISSAAERTFLEYIDYDCNRGEWSTFNSRFSLHSYSVNCEATKHSNFEDNPPADEGNVLFFYPYEDHNNAFCTNANVCHRMLNWDENAPSVRMRRAYSVDYAMDELDKYKDNSIKHAVLGGHGSGSQLHWGPGRECGGSHLCVGSYKSDRFLKKLSQKMHQHGSIFLDSCLSSTTNQSKWTDGKNLASWAAGEVGKGIRVIGSVLSFGKVRVERFKAWHARIDVYGEGNNVQRTSLASGARCPSWAASSSPDYYGDCSCPSGQTCTTTAGNACPRSKGRNSNSYFLPVCAEDWSKVKCQCA
jgi:hypothetical protein